MAPVPLPPYEWPGGPIPNVTPFTYRDGLTFLQRFERLIAWINKDVITYIDDNVSGLSESFTTEVNRLIDGVNTALEEQTEEVDQKILDLTVYVNNAVNSIINSSVVVQDPVMNGIINNIASQTRITLNGLYQAKNTVADTAVKGHVDNPASGTRVSLDALYQGKNTASDSAVTALINSLASTTRQLLDDLYQPIDVTGNIISDAVSEWWCHPVATQLSDPYSRTVFGAIATNGDVLACEFNHTTKETHRVKVGTAAVDDHDAPALWVAPGRLAVIAWTDHNRDNIIKLKVGAKTGDIRSFANSPLVSINLGGAAAYTQIHKIKHKSSDVVDCLWIFTRKGNDEWGYVEVVIDQRTGSVLWRNFRSILTAPGRQCYVSTADAYRPDGYNQIIRMGWGYNPAQAIHDIYYMEIDVVSERIGSPVQPSWTAQLGTTLVDSSITLAPLVPHNGTGNSRRFFYVRPGPDAPAVAYADWAEATPDNATYYVKEFTSGGVLVSSAGGYIETPSAPIASFSRGFECEVVFDLPAVISGNMGIISMSTSGSQAFFLRLTPAGDLEFAVYNTAGTAFAYHTSTAPIAADMVPGATLGLRVHIDLDALHVARYITRDNGKTWTQIGTGSAIPAGDAIVTDGIRATGRAPLRVPYAATLAESGKVNVRSFSLRSKNRSAELAGADFTKGEWLGGIDTHGLIYTMITGATVNAPTWATDSMGVAGPRVGYTPEANYIAGMVFENPSTMKRVITAHSASGTEILKLWNFVSGDYVATDLTTQPSATARIIRPFVPVNGRADMLAFNNMRYYGSSYTDYQGDLKLVVP